jgi:hypothetical protein
MSTQKASTEEVVICGIDYKLFGDQALERTITRDVTETIIKKNRENGVVISISIDNTFTKITLIIENPNNLDGIIVGTLEIPFPELDKIGKILSIPGVIDIRLFKCNGTPPPLSSPSAAFSLPAKSDYNKETMAVKISNIYGRSSSGPSSADDFTPVVSKSKSVLALNHILGDALKTVITNNKEEIRARKCPHWNNTNNCIEAAKNPNVELFICGRCKRYLADKDEFKCTNASCTNAVYIDIKGNVKNQMCNSCCSNN